MTTIHAILDEFKQAAYSNRDLGDKFERLIANYLVTDPLYQDKYSDVWLWGEWPGRGNQPDTGIDLVARERYTGGYCAIQCKFYDPEHSLQRKAILILSSPPPAKALPPAKVKKHLPAVCWFRLPTNGANTPKPR